MTSAKITSPKNPKNKVRNPDLPKLIFFLEKKSSEEPEKEPQEEKGSLQEGFMRVEIDIRDILITVPASDLSITNSPHVLALRGT